MQEIPMQSHYIQNTERILRLVQKSTNRIPYLINFRFGYGRIKFLNYVAFTQNQTTFPILIFWLWLQGTRLVRVVRPFLGVWNILIFIFRLFMLLIFWWFLVIFFILSVWEKFQMLCIFVWLVCMTISIIVFRWTWFFLVAFR